VVSPWLSIAVDADPLERAQALRRAHDGVLSGGPAPASVREVVVASWARSARAGVDPARRPPRMISEEAAAARLADHPLTRTLPLMRRALGGVAEEARHIMVLSDADGMLLWAEGHAGMLEAAAMSHFMPGALCSEAAAGTNAVGTALALDRALQIFSAEHFSSLFHGWTCAAAPIHDPSTGALLGSIDLSGNFRTAHPHTVSLVAAVAKMAEDHLALEAARRDARVRERYLALVMRGSHQPSALVTGAGRVLMSNPPSWLADGVRIPSGADRFVLPSGVDVAVEPLESGEAFVLWQVDRSTRRPPRPQLRLQTLGRRRASLSQNGGTVELSRRHSEILTLLVLHPEGLTSEELAGEMYGSDAKAGTVRAEMSRLRRLLGCLLVGNPYRVVGDVEADFLDVERLLASGDIEKAARRYHGPMLGRSMVPGIVEARERIEQRLGARMAAA
jgi:hypothetical protein